MQAQPRTVHSTLSAINDYLLVPVLLVVALEAFGYEVGALDLAFCAMFFAEWCLGLWRAEHRLAWLRRPANIIDLASSLPLGAMFQGLRVVRLVRLVRLLRLDFRPFSRPRTPSPSVLALLLGTRRVPDTPSASRLARNRR